MTREGLERHPTLPNALNQGSENEMVDLNIEVFPGFPHGIHCFEQTVR